MNIRKICLMLAALTVALALFACGEEGGEGETSGTDSSESEAPVPSEITYKVTVKDALGDPITEGVVVRFLSASDEQLSMSVIGPDGTASKVMEAGEYKVALSFTAGDDKFYYDTAAGNLTAESPETEIMVAGIIPADAVGSTFSAYIPTSDSNGDVTAYSIGLGGTYVQLEEGRNYFTFTPSLAGLYEISTTDPNAVIGYYGSRHFVQRENIADRENNVLSVSIQASMIGTGDTGTTVLVLGVDAGADLHDCIITIKRAGDPEFSISEVPWQTYAPTVELSPYKLPDGASVKEFDLTAEGEAPIVFNETDGYYHYGHENGPLVLAKLGVKSAYLDSLQVVLDTSGINRYFFDENGDFVKKEEYSDCLLKYIANMDTKSGYYPLTEDLVYIFTQRGDYVGWWDIDSPGYIFYGSDGEKIKNINPDIAWLFLCSYIEE